MNTYEKYIPNVFLAKCEEKYSSGDKIMVTTKYGKENQSIVFNLISVKNGFFYYSIIRSDGMDAQKYAEKKAQTILARADKANIKSDEFYKKSNKDNGFLSLAEPIKIGHHSEKRHRKTLEEANNNMRKCVEFSDKATELEEKYSYSETRSTSLKVSEDWGT